MRSVILFTFAALLLLNCSEASPSNGIDSHLDSPTPSTPRYVEQYSGRGENENGTPFAFHTYKGPNGEKVATKFEVYNSIAASEVRFDEIVKSSLKVVEEGPLLDSNGSQVGNRTILQIRSSDTSAILFKLLLRNGTRLHIVESESAENLQDFEIEYLPSVFRTD